MSLFPGVPRDPAKIDGEGDCASGIGDLDPPITPIRVRLGALPAEFADGLDGLGSGLFEIGHVDSDLIWNEDVPIREMEVVTLHLDLSWLTSLRAAMGSTGRRCDRVGLAMPPNGR